MIWQWNHECSFFIVVIDLTIQFKNKSLIQNSKYLNVQYLKYKYYPQDNQQLKTK